MRWNRPAPPGISADPPGNSADPPGEYEKEKENATERLAFSFFIFCGTEFALENRIYWLCRLAGANRKGRVPGKRRLCWRGPTKAQGLAGSKAPTGKAARRGNGASVGVARRRRKGLREARRQHGRPRARITAPLLAWPDEGARAYGKQGANMEARAPGKRCLCWRGLTKAQGLAGSKAPTWKAERSDNGASVGVA